MNGISQDDFNAFKEQIFKEFHHMNVVLQEIRDSFDSTLLPKNENSPFPLKVVSCQNPPQAELRSVNTAAPAASVTVNTNSTAKATPHFETPKQFIRISEKRYDRPAFPRTTNRFEGLRIYDCNPDEYEVEWPLDAEPCRRHDSRPQPKLSDSSFSPALNPTKRRPNVVTSNFPENDDPANYRKVKTVPEKRPFNKTQNRNITIVGDSLIRSIRREEINEEATRFGLKDVTIEVCKFPAGTVRQIDHYAKINIWDNEADGLIVHAGTNSLRPSLKLSDEKIAEDIIKIGKEAQRDGVRKVLISSLIFRKSRFFNTRISNINKILYDLCHQNGFIFIDNTNIDSSYLKDGLHLNFDGNDLLKQNFLQALY